MKPLGQWTKSEIDFPCFVRHQPNHEGNMQRPPDLTQILISDLDEMNVL